jgi:hypothetical protein
MMDRLDKIEADLRFTADLLKQMSLRQVGLRGMYRQGVHRFEEMLDRQDHQDALLSALIDSQMRTEASLQRMEAGFEKLQQSHGELADAQKSLNASLERLSDTFDDYLKSRQRN